MTIRAVDFSGLEAENVTSVIDLLDLQAENIIEAGASPGTVASPSPSLGDSVAVSAGVTVSPPAPDPKAAQQDGVGSVAVPERGGSTLNTQRVTEPSPPLAYRGLMTGPEFQIEYEAVETLPVSAASKLLRNLSPFVIQVEPPLVFGNLPPREGRAKRRLVGIYESAANASASSYSAARERLAQEPYTSPGFGGAVDQVRAVNSTGTQTSGSSDGQAPPAAPDGSGRLAAPSIADLQTAMDIAMQLQAIQNAPPLVLLINPQSLQRTFTKVQQYSDRSRYGYIFQAWGEDQPKLAISGKIGAFMAGTRGVQFASRRDSAAWQNLMTVLQFYKSNGYIYDTLNRSNAHHHVGALSIRYDQWVYYGHMQSMSFSLDENTTNGGVTFELQFVVSAMQDTAQSVTVVRPMKAPTPSPSDPRYTGLQNRARNEPGAYYGFEQEEPVRYTLPPTGPEVRSSSTARPTSQPANSQGFQPVVSTLAVPAQQAPANSRSLRNPFTLIRTGVNLP